MAERALPESVERLVTDCIPSVVHLEALLHLRSRSGADVTVDEIAERLFVPGTQAARVLSELTSRGLLQERRPSSFTYAPATPASSAAVDELAETYRTRLVPLHQFIHERQRSSAAHDFANAFRLRKD
jgi:DNA-binding IclR family transcriptional regulator